LNSCASRQFFAELSNKNLRRVSSLTLTRTPPLITRAGPSTRKKFFEFFTVPIRNAQTYESLIRARRCKAGYSRTGEKELPKMSREPTMATWSKDEQRKVAETEDLHISPFREDGVTHGTPTWIWSVVVNDALYLRGYNGQNSRWYQAAVRQKAGRIIAAGMTKEVTFEPVEGPINNRIDDAYRVKYHGSPYLNPMISARARAATVKVMPRV
jgi:hypothetical protein